MVKQQYYTAREISTLCSVSDTKAYALIKKLGMTMIDGCQRVECNKLHDYLDINTKAPYRTERERRRAMLRRVD